MQNPLTCHSEERSDEESRTVPENHLKTETFRYAQSDMLLICIQTLVIPCKDSTIKITTLHEFLVRPLIDDLITIEHKDSICPADL